MRKIDCPGYYEHPARDGALDQGIRKSDADAADGGRQRNGGAGGLSLVGRRLLLHGRGPSRRWRLLLLVVAGALHVNSTPTHALHDGSRLAWKSHLSENCETSGLSNCRMRTVTFVHGQASTEAMIRLSPELLRNQLPTAACKQTGIRSMQNAHTLLSRSGCIQYLNGHGTPLTRDQ